MKVKIGFLVLSVLAFSAIIWGCSNDSVSTSNLTDDDYIKSVITSGYDNSQSNEDNLMAQTISDLNDGYAISDLGTTNPIDSLKKWGRLITNVDVNFTITNEGDSLKDVSVTRNITGTYHIIGYLNGTIDSITKPYTEVLKNNLTFKRINNSSDVRKNWRLYKTSMLNGETVTPQQGTSQVQMNKIEVYVNGTLQYTYNGPDFTQNVFTTKLFGGTGIPQIDRGSLVELKVYTTSQNPDIDYVAWHWMRNSFGFHREPFRLISQTGSGPYQRIYSKSFYLFGNHGIGAFNGYISANTHASIYDDNPALLASHETGLIYRVTK